MKISLHRTLLLVVALPFAACSPAASHDDGGLPDAASAEDDAGEPPGEDAGRPDHDAGTPPREDAGTPPENDAGSVDPPLPDAGALVDAGAPLSCDPGFVSTAQGCAPDAPEPFLSRTEDDVCARWQADYQSVFPEWQAQDASDACDPGVVPAAALDNALRRTNLYRWLAGLGDVVLDDTLFARQQACSVLQHAMGGLNHHPAPSAPCYTAEGAAGAGSSNLAYGAGLAGSLDLYIGDVGVPSLGHRRWVLNPAALTTQFGHKSGWSCMYSFSSGGSASPPFVAYPPPGFVPRAAARGTFSFSSTTYRPTGDTVVEIAIGDGDFTEVAHTSLTPGYGWGSTISYTPPGGTTAAWTAGTTLRVRVRNTSAGDVGWTTHFTGC